MRFKATCVGLLMLCGSFQANAALSVANYKEMKATAPAAARMYVRGLGEGISWSEIHRTAEERRPSYYCTPPNLALGVDNYIDILERQIDILERELALREAAGSKGLKGLDSFYIEPLLVFGLVKTFPCD